MAGGGLSFPDLTDQLVGISSYMEESEAKGFRNPLSLQWTGRPSDIDDSPLRRRSGGKKTECGRFFGAALGLRRKQHV